MTAPIEPMEIEFDDSGIEKFKRDLESLTAMTAPKPRIDWERVKKKYSVWALGEIPKGGAFRGEEIWLKIEQLVEEELAK